MTTKKLEPKALLDRMRKLTAELLGYDLSNLSPAESVRLDRAATLRLELDDVQSRQLAGLPIDLAKFILVSKELEAMLGGTPDAPVSFDVDGVIADLEQSIQGILDVRALKAAEADPHPGSGVAQSDEGCPHPPLAAPDAPAARCGSASEHPLLIEPPPQPAPPPKRVESDTEKMARVNAQPVPSHYLKSGEPEPWRDYVNSDGSINTSPWRRY